ncbi:hypothetical protein SAMN04489765_0930 [Tsukamurella pulmonis]|uniref:Uncharacterized protein n=1 Tax=Tsukamurella pulmonis TaxID=47312 RepID=A0A1H1BYS8_9ACTN|nr:hypothetical protein SAMN04489765_0930 [Tsukamurella pulmonis]SUP24467.1 Uncharacterised protein [Tsukamurella pulmonis]
MSSIVPTSKGYGAAKNFGINWLNADHVGWRAW